MEEEVLDDWNLASMFESVNEEFASHNSFPPYSELLEAFHKQDADLFSDRLNQFSRHVDGLVANFLCEIHTAGLQIDPGSAPVVADLFSSLELLQRRTAQLSTAWEKEEDIDRLMERLPLILNKVQDHIDTYQEKHPYNEEDEYTKHRFLNSVIRSCVAFQAGALSDDTLHWKLSLALDQTEHFLHFTLPAEDQLYSQDHKVLLEQTIAHSQDIHHAVDHLLEEIESYEEHQDQELFAENYEKHLVHLCESCEKVDQLLAEKEEFEKKACFKSCPHCASDIVISDRFCPSCNKRLPQWTSESSSQSDTPQGSHSPVLDQLFVQLEEVQETEKTFPKAMETISSLTAWLGGQKIVLVQQEELDPQIQARLIEVFDQYIADLFTIGEMAQNQDMVHLPNLKERIYLHDQNLREIAGEVERSLN